MPAVVSSNKASYVCSNVVPLTISLIDKRLRRHIKFPIRLSDGIKTVSARALLDCGASSIFINASFVNKHDLRVRALDFPIPLRNVDNSGNSIGDITHEVLLTLMVGEHSDDVAAAVANIGDDDVIVGIDWLRFHNPEVNWTKEELKFTRCPDKCTKPSDPPKVMRSRRRRKDPPCAGFGISVAEMEGDEVEDVGEVCAEDLEVALRLEAGCMRGVEDVDDFWGLTAEDLALRVAAGSTYSQAIAEQSALKEGEKTFEELVPPEFRDFAHVFSKAESERLPMHKPYDLTIDLEPGTTPTFSKLYPMAPAEKTSLNEFIEDYLRKGYIRPSKSPAAAPIFFVKKKDGSLRMVVDYRKLNSITVKNRYPLPLSMELVDSLQRAKVFTMLDLRWGYHNVRIKAGDEWKAAFQTHLGLFEPTVMLFGLTNAPAAFQHMMNDIFKDLLGVCVVIYLDDILIFSEHPGEHEGHVREVLRRLREHDLFLKPEKCRSNQSEVEYLGLIVGEGRVEMDKGKVSAVLDWPTPKKVKDIQAFLGFANFYRRFIGDFSKTVRPMTELLRKDTKWVWGQRQQEAFDELKRCFTTAPILAMPDLEKPFVLECDASDFATGAVLSQVGGDGQVHPIAFYSKSLNDAERNYEIYDKELLAIVRALGEWR